MKIIKWIAYKLGCVKRVAVSDCNLYSTGTKYSIETAIRMIPGVVDCLVIAKHFQCLSDLIRGYPTFKILVVILPCDSMPDVVNNIDDAISNTKPVAYQHSLKIITDEW